MGRTGVAGMKLQSESPDWLLVLKAWTLTLVTALLSWR